MVLQLKLRKIGNSVGVVLPKEALAHLDVEEGDTIAVTDAGERTLRLISADPEFTKQMDAARRVMRRYRNALRELAK